METGDPGRAAGLFKALLEHQTRVLGPDHIHTLSTRLDLAVAHDRLGRQAEAIAELRRLLADMRSLPHPDAALVLRTVQLLHACTQQHGR